YAGKFTSGVLNNFEVSDDGLTIRPWDNGIVTATGNISIGGSGKYTPQNIALIAGLKTQQGFSQAQLEVNDRTTATLTTTYSQSTGDIPTSGITMTNFIFFRGNPYLPPTA